MTDFTLQTVILEEVRALRTSLDAHRAETGERLATLETHMESLVGNHQPGRLTLLENKVSAIQQWRHYTTGIYIGVSGIVSAATAFIYHLWK
jgi:hypothetical protein